MLQIKEWRISTWIVGALQMFGRSLPSVVSLECPHCGCAFVARVEVGTSSFVCAIDWSAPNSSRSKHVVVVTQGARLSISCDPSLYVKQTTTSDSGSRAGISCTRTSSHHSGRPCGCDPGARHVCDEHSSQADGYRDTSELATHHGAGCCDELNDD